MGQSVSNRSANVPRGLQLGEGGLKERSGEILVTPFPWGWLNHAVNNGDLDGKVTSHSPTSFQTKEGEIMALSSAVLPCTPEPTESQVLSCKEYIYFPLPLSHKGPPVMNTRLGGLFVKSSAPAWLPPQDKFWARRQRRGRGLHSRNKSWTCCTSPCFLLQRRGPPDKV